MKTKTETISFMATAALRDALKEVDQKAGISQTIRTLLLFGAQQALEKYQEAVNQLTAEIKSPGDNDELIARKYRYKQLISSYYKVYAAAQDNTHIQAYRL